jgi:hypothetical protein
MICRKKVRSDTVPEMKYIQSREPTRFALHTWMNEENRNLSKLLEGTPGYSDTKLIICEDALQDAGCGRRLIALTAHFRLIRECNW